MKKQDKLIAVLLLFSILLLYANLVSCTGVKSNFDVFGHTADKENFIASTEDITNLVTDDEKLVINYYDAYIWIVYFDNFGSIERMAYIYTFNTEQEALEMIDVRKEELETNKTMTIINARSIDKYLIVELKDTSFTNVTRSMLETNFSGLIVY